MAAGVVLDHRYCSTEDDPWPEVRSDGVATDRSARPRQTALRRLGPIASRAGSSPPAGSRSSRASSASCSSSFTKSLRSCGGATVVAERVRALPDGAPLAVLTDEYRELAAALDSDGHVRVARLASGEILADVALVEGGVASERVTAPPGSTAFVVATTDGRVIVQRRPLQCLVRGKPPRRGGRRFRRLRSWRWTTCTGRLLGRGPKSRPTGRAWSSPRRSPETRSSSFARPRRRTR